MLDKYKKIFVCRKCGQNHNKMVLKCEKCGNHNFEIRPKVVTKES